MSAFVVSEEHINGLLQACRGSYPGEKFSYYWEREGAADERVYVGTHTGDLSREELGQKLLDECYRSVYRRYGARYGGSDSDRPVAYRFEYNRNGRYLEPVELLKLLACYGYQACESDDWARTEAYAIVQALQDVAIRRLEGYEDAPWSL